VEAIARDVYWLALGRGLNAVNVYLIGTPEGWCLVDAGWPGHADDIRRAAAGLFGPGSRPAAILLTHCHPDHSGAASELARTWDCPVRMHPLDLPLAHPDLAAVRDCGGPLDRWLILPVLRAMGAKRSGALLEKSDLRDRAQALDPETPLPGPSGWLALHTPGHTRGHIALIREEDGVVVTGDALTTVDVNSPLGPIRGRATLGRPPWITTWDWAAAGRSMDAVVARRPRVIAPGHGAPLSGDDADRLELEFLARRGLIRR